MVTNKYSNVVSSRIFCEACCHRWLVQYYVHKTKGTLPWTIGNGTVQVCPECGETKRLKIVQLNWE